MNAIFMAYATTVEYYLLPNDAGKPVDGVSLPQHVEREVRGRLWSLVFTSVRFWVLWNATNFVLIPARYRVLYTSGGNCGTAPWPSSAHSIMG